MRIFNRLESEVRGYIRSFPTIFSKAQNAVLTDESGSEYIDFLAGAGTLNYGHNNPILKQAAIEYLSEDGIVHGLDMATSAKKHFLQTFETHILKPRKLQYKIQFTGPTGTNAVEAAIKLARNATGRQNVISFTNGFHGVSLGSLALTGNRKFRDAAGTALNDVQRAPYSGYFGQNIDTIAMLDKLIVDPSSGVDLPAAVIVECVQGEGGLNVAGFNWLKKLEQLCQRHEILLIVDDIQAGCGRTGTFFSFEEMGIQPDIVTLSKSLSGYGLPFAMVLLRQELDQWKPGEHNGTFRGNNHAFVTAAAALEHFWQNDEFAQSVRAKGKRIADGMHKIVRRYGPDSLFVKGRGMMIGISCPDGDTAAAICRHAFENGLVIETSGAHSEVVKCLCPLVISEEQIDRAMSILDKAFAAVMSDQDTNQAAS